MLKLPMPLRMPTFSCNQQRIGDIRAADVLASCSMRARKQTPANAALLIKRAVLQQVWARSISHASNVVTIGCHCRPTSMLSRESSTTAQPFCRSQLMVTATQNDCRSSSLNHVPWPLGQTPCVQVICTPCFAVSQTW